MVNWLGTINDKITNIFLTNVSITASQCLLHFHMSTIIISCQILSCFFGTLSVCMYVFEKMSAGKKTKKFAIYTRHDRCPGKSLWKASSKWSWALNDVVGLVSFLKFW